MEYMALKKPIVQYTLKEGKYSAQDASLYATNTDPKDFGDKIIKLLDDEALRNKMGNYGYNRVLNELSWEHENKNLICIYNKVFSKKI
jgi:glycosyltransferase involved in cell wall biosynthesis